MMFGLCERDLDCIFKALGSFAEIERAVVFGSRAMGNYKKGSGVDLAVFGEKVTNQTIFALMNY